MSSEVQNYNWGGYDFSKRNIKVVDTSLRDGLQDAELRHPMYAEKEQFIERISKLPIDVMDIAIPIAGGPHLRDAKRLARQLPPHIQVACLARTDEADVRAAAELMQGAGRPVEVILFTGTSPLRQKVEGWTLPMLTKRMEISADLARKEGLIINVATEHTTESEPDTIIEVYRAGLANGAKVACIADTTGAANEVSTRNIVRFFRERVLKGHEDVELDWHGHDDLGLSVANSLVALDAGADRVHGTALGIGERAGNTPIEQMLQALKVYSDPRRQDLTQVLQFSEYASQIFGVDIRPNYPGIGSKVGKTASGIHAAAMRKARLQGLEPGSPYSSVNQEWYGRKSGVVVGPLSGRANVEEVLDRLGINANDQIIDEALEVAKSMNTILSDSDIINIVNSQSSNGYHHGHS